jgi:hypothetical protein
MSRPRKNTLRSVGNLLVADLDEHTFGFVHPRTVPLIQNPLDLDHGKDDSSVEVLPGQYENDKTSSSIHHEHHKHHHDRATVEPVLRYHHESSSIQLFYDLFFVANLTNFTSKHEVTDPNSM